MDRISVVCALAAVLLFANTWQGDFVYDDSRAIVSNEDLRPSTPWLDVWRHDFWGTPLDHAGSHQSWRPLCVLSFRLNYSWSELNPTSYHLVNILLHALVTLCLTRLMKSFIRTPWIRCLSGLAFAAHPIHCEAVASVVGRAELGSALHTLVALLAYRAHLRLTRRRHHCPSRIDHYHHDGQEEKISQSESSIDDESHHRFQRPSDSLLSLLIRRVTICCYCPDQLSGKKSQYSAAAATERLPTLSHHGLRSNRQRYHRQEPRDGWQSGAYLVTAVVAASTAFLWKETGLAAIPLCAAMDLAHKSQPKPGKRQSSDRSSAQEVGKTRNLVLLSAVLAGQLALRCYMLGGGKAAPWFAAADNPVSRHASLLTRTLTFFHLPALNAGLLLWPAWLSFDWSMDAVAPISQWSDRRNAATLIFYACLACLLVKSWKSRRTLAMAVCLLVIPFLPATNLFFYVGFVVAERVLYTPSMGFCLLLAIGVEKWTKSPEGQGTHKRKRLVQLCFAVTLLFWSMRTVHRNGDWSNEEQLYRSGIAINPAKAYGNLAAILAREHRQAEAEHAYRQALTHRPNMAETHFNLALLLQSQGRHQEASSSYQKAIHYRPNLAAAYLNLGLLLRQQGQHDEAAHWFNACSQLDGSGVRDPHSHRQSQIQALLSWGQLELARNQASTAIRLYKQALRRSPTSVQQLQAVYHSLGEAYQSTGDYRESERWFRTAIEQVQVPVERRERQDKRTITSGGQPTRSDQVAAHLTYARFLAKNASRHDEAEQLFRQAQLMAPTDPSVYMLTGQFLLEASRPREAAESFVRAAHLAPADFEAVFNAATTLREVKELDRAELFYRQAVQLRPQDVTVYRNLGALLHVKGEWREAEDNYQLALRLAPDDRITLTNLKRLHQLIASKVAAQSAKNKSNTANNNTPTHPTTES